MRYHAENDFSFFFRALELEMEKCKQLTIARGLGTEVKDSSDARGIVSEAVSLIFNAPRDSLSIEYHESDSSLFSNTLGCFTVRCPDNSSFFVKVVDPNDIASANLCDLLQRIPSLASSSYLSIPTIVSLISRDTGDRVAYIHVSNWLCGFKNFATWMTDLWTQGDESNVFDQLEKFGKFVRAFHDEFPGVQHNDLNPMNVMVADSFNFFILVDCAGLDDSGGHDVSNFLSCLEDMCLGSEFIYHSKRAFLSGYSNS
jgi:hypothetical protein